MMGHYRAYCTRWGDYFDARERRQDWPSAGVIFKKFSNYRYALLWPEKWVNAYLHSRLSPLAHILSSFHLLQIQS